ncbi:methyl-accepting chemotaxis protein [Lysinibacillus agricola]|uniref:Methyl-accepting chemotaxis protein n=1 Tax=Lysinibacillus agricola TaxID=2590012 RepID=A0ABX7B0K1_9BACI|nr:MULTISPECIES: methyl-accepting chemotaxis protein [Lysinibacillus]KOS60305.1 chemotaxis protein [Lysinibacillus sp. FJAT-14222]QQP14598.1 methyl-accepting chemotaxis protein [Lysinibacillus agricola]
MNFKSISKRIVFSFSIVIAVVVLYIGYNYYAVSQSNSATEQIVDEELQLLITDYEQAQTIGLRIAAARGYVLSGEKKYKEIFEENVKHAEENEKIRLAISESADFSKFAEMAKEWSRYVEQEVFTVYDQGKIELATKNLATMNEKATEIREGYEGLAEHRKQAINVLGADIIKSGENKQLTGIIVGIVIVIVAIIIALLSARVISRPIITLTNRMQRITEGDLSEPALIVNSKDEVGQLMEATNAMSDILNRLLKQIQTVSNDVAAHSEELMQSATEVKTGTEQIVDTVTEIASGTEVQASNASDVATTMAEFTLKMTDVNNSSKDVHQYSKNVMSLTKEGQGLMDASTEQMTSIHHIVKDAVYKVDELSKQTQEISKIVSVIQDIAAQTNLLALNAAIEAARAGEHGKGFAVVADEVRKLAEQVAVSVDDITSIVQRIQQDSNMVTSSLENGYGEVEKGTTQIASTNETFSQIAKAVYSMSTNIDSMSTKLEEVVQNTVNIHKSVDEIAAVSEQSAAGIQETSATVEQAASSMDEINNSSENLAGMAENLNELIRKFKL